MGILIFAGILGLCIGSFLNVVIYRVPRKLSVIEPVRSFCPSCERQLTWWENIPVFSWLGLLGKCRTCKTSISGQYPLVEILSGIGAMASYMYYGATPTGVLVYILTATLIAITFIDLEFKIIPNVISLPGIAIALCIGIVSEYTSWFSYPITMDATDSLLGFLAGGGFFYVIGEIYYYIAKRDGLGGGDIKLLAMTGALLGWRSVAPTIFVGSFLGAIIGIGLIIMKRGDRQLEIPFGPWLSLGVLIYIFMDLPYFRF